MMRKTAILDWNQMRPLLFSDGNVFYPDHAAYQTIARKFVTSAAEAGYPHWEILDDARAAADEAEIYLTIAKNETRRYGGSHPPCSFEIEAIVKSKMFVAIANEAEHQMAVAAERTALQDAGYQIIDNYTAEPTTVSHDLDSDWEVLNPMPLVPRISNHIESTEDTKVLPNQNLDDSKPNIKRGTTTTSSASNDKSTLVDKAWR
ncbi:hypothetical protein QBC43DRAFT_337009 [Cladorrhinum sp. PSN259]|nr:hypothetical protein QBC43DRAFT_337009 [Cladorrhinum sp. PSN259]